MHREEFIFAALTAILILALFVTVSGCQQSGGSSSSSSQGIVSSPCTDEDEDGFPLESLGCGGVAVDCDDNDPDNWTSCGSCEDQDADAWFIGCDAYVIRSGPDCDDDLANAWDDCSDCNDGDGDGYGSGGSCSGLSDCNDTLINAWNDCSDCVDNDGDGFGTGASCSGSADCDDAVINAWADCSDCIDGDTDGWGSGSSCSGALDCDDGIDHVFPTAPEICDCNDNQCPGDAGQGLVDEGCLAIEVSGGGAHSCAIILDGPVKCWGSNLFGQLGDGSTTQFSSTPVCVPGVASAVSVEAGQYHTCALLAGDSVFCWGSNEHGQLGDGTTANSDIPMPALISGASVQSLAAGGLHSCAVISGGSVFCWGYNAYGQLGDGSTTSALSIPSPVDFAGDTAAQDIASGGMHSCAALEDGSARCWGLNNKGQLGDGSTAFSSNAPLPVLLSGDTAVSGLAGGWFHTCAFLEDGSVRCWGMNNSGQLGDGNAVPDSNVPVAVLLSGNTAAIGMDAGGDSTGAQTCLVLAGGPVRCWGENSYGQLGDDNQPSDSGVPVPVWGGMEAVYIDAGGLHSCSLLDDGSVKCWGYNSSGQLGDGTENDSSVPVPVLNMGP